MRPCTRSSPFTAEQKPAYQPLKLVAPLVGYCLPVAGVNLEKVCMQGSYPASKEREAEYFKVSYWRDAKQILEWRSDGFLMSPAESFSVELVNVDGDNALELVVTVMTGESMGMGVQSADIFVVDRQHLRVSEPMLRIMAVSQVFMAKQAKRVVCWLLRGRVARINKKAVVYMLKGHGINLKTHNGNLLRLCRA